MLAKGHATEGAVVVTDEQTRGRGQRGNAWEARPGQNLTFSLVLSPGFLLPRQHFYLNMAVALAVRAAAAEALGNTQGTQVKVKWPNDIFCQDRKIAGILIENTLSGSTMRASVVGIGLNVNQSAFADARAASLHTLTGHTYPLPPLLERLLELLEAHYLMLKEGRTQALAQAYTAHLYQFNEVHTYQDLRTPVPQAFTGAIRAVNEDGSLAVENLDNGSAERFYFKEIKFVQ